MSTTIQLHLRRQFLAQDPGGHNRWETETVVRMLPGSQVAIIVCDMWDNHWSRGAAERVDAMAPCMDRVLAAARSKGVHIIHAPSNTLDFYETAPARLRMLAVPSYPPPTPLERPDPPLPIDDSDEGSDTGETTPFRAWIRQHPALHIDQQRDGISDNGQEIYSYLRHHQIAQTLIMGVHTNMCVLNRSFGIKQMVRWGVEIALVRDLTDTMYNPAMCPYVSHDEGTRLVIGYIEKFWCPSVASTELTEPD